MKKLVVLGIAVVAAAVAVVTKRNITRELDNFYDHGDWD